MTFAEFVNRIRNKIWPFLKNFFYHQRLEEFPYVMNIGYDAEKEKRKALICYQDNCFFTNLDMTATRRTQPYEIITIVNAFVDAGYIVDIVDCSESRIPEQIRSRRYDLIFGFGESFYQATNLNPDAVSVLYMTESPPEFSFREETKRLDYYFERHGRRNKIIRSGKFYKKHHLEKVYSYVITMGETFLLKDKYPDPISISPTGLSNPDFVFKSKDHSVTRKQFLWLGSLGAIHKGLDILLDIFAQQDEMTLHICGLSKYEKRLLRVPARNNIVDHGYVFIHSDDFLEIVNKCSYIILLSCAEGCSTSILTGMLHGLVPVVMKDTGFNKFGENVILFEDYMVEYVTEKLKNLTEYDPVKLSILSRKIFDYANSNFTISEFNKNFRSILNTILKG